MGLPGLLSLWFFGFPWLVLALLGVPSPAGTNGGLQNQPDDQLVAVLYLRREDLPHALRGEIFPVARLGGGVYAEALVQGANPLTGETPSPDRPSTSLERFRDFTVYNHGQTIGRFSVKRVEAAVYSCNAVMVGLGELELPEAFVRFGRFDPRVRSISVSGQGVRYEYSLNYYLALAQPVPQHGFLADSTSDPAAVSRLRATIWTEGIAALSDYGPGPWHPNARWEEPHWAWRQGFQVFDLDRDGRLEAMGVLEAIVSDEVSPPDEPLATRQFVATAVVWASDRGPDERPAVLHVLRHARDAAHWDFGYHLAEVMDLDGDGRAEAFYQVEAWEYHGFRIYALKDGALEEVFSGAAYGC